MTILEQLQEAGYQTYNPPEYKNATRLFQKKYSDDKGVKYFIDCYEYDFRDYSTIETFKYSFQTQFTLPSGDYFSVDTVQWFYEETRWNHKINTLKDVEEFFEKIWTLMNCRYYDYTQED